MLPIYFHFEVTLTSQRSKHLSKFKLVSHCLQCSFLSSFVQETTWTACPEALLK